MASSAWILKFFKHNFNEHAYKICINRGAFNLSEGPLAISFYSKQFFKTINIT